MRPRYLPSTPPGAASWLANLLLLLFQIAFIVSSAQLLGVSQAVTSAWSWLADLQSQTSR